MVHFNWSHSSPRLKPEFNHHIECRNWVRIINLWLLTARHPLCRPTTCPRFRKKSIVDDAVSSGHGDTVIGNFVTGGSASSLTSPASNYIAAMVGLESAGVNGRDILMLVCKQYVIIRYDMGHISLRVFWRMLRETILPWAKDTFFNFVLVQDNAPPSKVRTTITFLENREVKIIDCPARSPDVNPSPKTTIIERTFSILWLFLFAMHHSFILCCLVENMVSCTEPPQ